MHMSCRPKVHSAEFDSTHVEIKHALLRLYAQCAPQHSCVPFKSLTFLETLPSPGSSLDTSASKRNAWSTAHVFGVVMLDQRHLHENRDSALSFFGPAGFEIRARNCVNYALRLTYDFTNGRGPSFLAANLISASYVTYICGVGNTRFQEGNIDEEYIQSIDGTLVSFSNKNNCY
jgi:hypothetical protein